MRLLKSPQIYVLIYGYSVSSSVSIYDVADISVMCRLVSDDVGGIYMFTMLILVLLGNINFVCIPYSFDAEASNFMGFFMYVASPPRVPPSRRDSTNVNPSSVGASAPIAIHVSYTHNMSISSCSSISNSFK
jgi:hypothetical protein